MKAKKGINDLGCIDNGRHIEANGGEEKEHLGNLIGIFSPKDPKGIGEFHHFVKISIARRLRHDIGHVQTAIVGQERNGNEA